MAFVEPLYNVWGRSWKPIATGPDIATVTWQFLGYFRAQQRQVPNHFAANFLVEVPKGLGFKKSTQTPFGLGYRIQLAGWEAQWARVYEVEDSAAGFVNEHRTLLCDRPDDITFSGDQGFYCPRVNPVLEPPEGFFLMGGTELVDFWEDPNMESNQWKSDGSAVE